MKLRSLEVSLTLVALVLLAFLVMQWSLEGIIHARKTQTVPDLKGRSVSSTLDILAPRNLGVRKEGTEFDNSVPVDAVLRQNPPAGAVVREGKVVRVVLSHGGVTVFVPSIVGMPLRNAEMLLRQGQLMLGEKMTETFSLRTEKGIVLSQDPEAETSVERGSFVNVVVSGGAPPTGVVLMPDFNRKDIAEALSWAVSAGLKVEVSTDATSLFPYGVILSQSPRADSVVGSDSKFSITISGRKKGPREGKSAKTFHYEVSQGGSESMVRIVVADRYGERELFNGLRRPGSKIDLPINDMPGGGRVKIYLNGVLVEERDL
ncbi:MAG: PASTA domain-containing protein [Elusimicrobia bacterium]|nr:PASTA domain-containing protein [Elusimicrobiota bacterium]